MTTNEIKTMLTDLNARDAYLARVRATTTRTAAEIVAARKLREANLDASFHRED